MRLPLLDIRRWRLDPAGFAEELRIACHKVGFFQLQHGLPSGLTRQAVQEAHAFFNQPTEEKQAMDYARSPAFRGYMATGVENTAGAADLREQVEIAAEEGSCSARAWPAHRRLRGPNQWPASQPTLQTVIGEYAEHMARVSEEITEALCMALNLERRAMSHLFEYAFDCLHLQCLSLPSTLPSTRFHHTLSY